ncbi:MAG TPA: redoxin domain-containing protein [Chloroflexota bacterium]
MRFLIPKRALWSLVIAVPLVALLAFGFQRNPDAVASPLIDKPAPTFQLHTIDGRTLSLASLRGHPVVLNFWASWCTACIDEHPMLISAWHTYQRRGVEFVGVVYDDTAGDARDFLRQRGGSWPSVEDPGQQTAIDYGVVKIPETYFIDRHGVVRYKSSGEVTPQILSRQLGRMLGKTA